MSTWFVDSGTSNETVVKLTVLLSERTLTPVPSSSRIPYVDADRIDRD